MTLNQLVIESVDVPILKTTPPPGLSFPDPAYPLAGALQAIGCNCFSVHSVERYQNAVVRRAKQRASRVEARLADFEMNLTAKPSDLLLGWLAALYFCLCAGAIISIPAVFLTTTVMPFTIVGWGGAAGLLVGVAAACLHGLQVYRTQRLTSTEVEDLREALATEVESAPILVWMETPSSKFKPDIPNPVRSLSWKVAVACPNVQMFVYHTVVERVGVVEQVRAKRYGQAANSFLEARADGERYFIAAWDEAKFRIPWAWTARR